MADIKTHLRELSVALGVYYEINDVDVNDLLNITPQEYFNISRQVISNNIDAANNILTLNSFNQDFISIINNGINLGKKIVELNLSSDYTSVIWVGGDTQRNDTVDLIIGNVGFSLKEESFILENMGLYKYLNLLTNSDFRRGLHAFNHFARDEYNSWFVCTWNKLLSSNLPWIYNCPNYTSEISSDENYIYFKYNDRIISRLPKREISIDEFMNLTRNKSREKIFAKWISNNLVNDSDYLEAKRLCSIKAGEEICNYIQDNLNPINLSRFLQIYDRGYYYAKSTSNELSIFYVPSLSEFNNIIEVSDVSFDVPSSQLNIKTILTNTETDGQLIIRNECRFSHGQFNGTPEAKMYYDRGNDLSIIYTRIL